MESFGQRLGHGKWAVTWVDARVGGGLLRIESVLPICGIDRGEEAREPDVLLPGDLGAGGRQTTDRPAAVPGHQRGSDGPPVRRPGRDARTGAAQGVRGSGRGLDDTEPAPGSGHDRPGGRCAALGCRHVGGHLPGVGDREPGGRALLEAGFADWWVTTAGPRFTKVGAPELLT